MFQDTARFETFGVLLGSRLATTTSVLPPVDYLCNVSLLFDHLFLCY